MTRHDEKGQMSLLIIGFFIVGVLLVAVVVDASAAYLRRTAMNNLADGAALAAAEAVRGEQVYTLGIDQRKAVVDADAAQPYVRAYLERTGALTEYPDLRWHVEQDGASVRVHVSAPLELPISVAGITDETTVAGEAVVEVRLS